MTQEAEVTLRPQLMRFVDGDNDDYRRYQALCRGDELRVGFALTLTASPIATCIINYNLHYIHYGQTPAQTKDLKCYYTDNNRDPWLLLQPVAVEVFNQMPFVCQFHKLLTDREAELVKELAAPMVRNTKYIVTSTSIRL